MEENPDDVSSSRDKKPDSEWDKQIKETLLAEQHEIDRLNTDARIKFNREQADLRKRDIFTCRYCGEHKEHPNPTCYSHPGNNTLEENPSLF